MESTLSVPCWHSPNWLTLRDKFLQNNWKHECASNPDNPSIPIFITISILLLTTLVCPTSTEVYCLLRLPLKWKGDIAWCAREDALAGGLVQGVFFFTGAAQKSS